MRRFQAPAAILLVWAATILASAAASPVSADTPTAYEVLQSYDFPVGLLPKGVVRYELDNSTGKFAAYLNGSCSFSLEGSYQIKYKSTIKGYISTDKLTKLEGISVKILFFWINIIEVTRSGDELDFSVGIASANFLISNFLECPQCGCGLDCVNTKQVRIGRLFYTS
ncbi:hypothetical protein ACLOJK_026250 [Asimina triloba]